MTTGRWGVLNLHFLSAEPTQDELANERKGNRKEPDMTKTTSAFFVAAILAAGLGGSVRAGEVDLGAAGLCTNLPSNAGVPILNASQFGITSNCHPLPIPFTSGVSRSAGVTVVDRSTTSGMQCTLAGYGFDGGNIFTVTESTDNAFTGSTVLLGTVSIPVSVYWVELQCNVPPQTSLGASGIAGLIING
jgi:hypothetical protein